MEKSLSPSPALAPKQGMRARLARLRQGLSPRDHPAPAFWVSLLLLNALLFLPLYLLNRETSTLLPIPLEGNIAVERLLLQRENFDLFRLNAEIILLAALWVFLAQAMAPSIRRIYRGFVVLFYVVALVYYAYEGAALTLYQVEPVFFSQYPLLLEGVGFVSEHLHISAGLVIGVTLLLMALVAFVALLLRTLLVTVPVERLGIRSRAALAVLAAVVVIVGWQNHASLASPKMALNSLVFKVRQNVNASLALSQSLRDFDPGVPYAVYDYQGNDLVKRPDIYLIFVESYGSVLYKRRDYRQAYEQLLDELQQELRENDWQMVTALSEAPTWGGGSWMSYTSALFGLRIDNHPQYLALLDTYQLRPYPDLGHYLKSQGYHYVRVSSLSNELNAGQWLRYKTFFGVDQWLRYSDLAYEGPRYGWGPAPPDQYVLNYAYETVVRNAEQPVFLFTITQNSHYPWRPLPELAEDWRSLNDPSIEVEEEPAGVILHPQKRQNYLDSIRYELEFLVDFIVETGESDTIYVLIGDHQPQQVSRREDGFDTPMHIISKDRDLVEAFLPYGFVPGLTVTDLTPPVRHEGFYSMFLEALLSRYGRSTEATPPYLPNGLLRDETRLPES